MFSQMIQILTQGCLPEKKELEKRLKVALVKKMAILRQPYLFWPQDPKINPPAAHLLWAAVLLEDKDNFSLAADILVTEKLESSPPGDFSDMERLRHELVSSSLEDLIQLGGNDDLQQQLRQKSRIFSTLQS